jgi:hypothetical protein
MPYLSFVPVFFMLLLSACSGRVLLQKQETRFVQPAVTQILTDTSAVIGFYPAYQTQFTITPDCVDTAQIYNEEGVQELDHNPRSLSTHEALSRDAFELALNSIVDSTLRAIFKHHSFSVLIPELGIGANDTFVDSILSLVPPPDSIYDPQKHAQTREIIKQVGARYGIEYLVMPAHGFLHSFPIKPCSRDGKYTTGAILQIWGTAQGELLYQAGGSYTVRAKGRETNLNKDWLQEWARYVGDDLQRVFTLP